MPQKKKISPKHRTADQWIDLMGGTNPKTRKRNTILSFLAIVASLFLLSNAGYFSKRIRHFASPIERHAVPSKASDDPLLRELSGVTNQLRIPNLGIEAPIIYAVERNETAYQDALKKGVAHFPGTAEPGKYGNTYIFGHSSDFPLSAGDYKTIFASLPDIKIGDAIYLTDAKGNAFRYLATETKIIKPNDLSALDQYENQKRMLTVQTSYPIGTALRRFIVVAELDAEFLK